MNLFPTTKITIAKPLPTEASIETVEGKVRLTFEIDLASELGKAMLAGRPPADLGGMVKTAMVEAVSKLMAAMTAAKVKPKGRA